MERIAKAEHHNTTGIYTDEELPLDPDSESFRKDMRDLE